MAQYPDDKKRNPDDTGTVASDATPKSVTPFQVAASKMGRKGGIARTASMSKSQRSKLAKKAAQARWKPTEEH